LAYNLDEYVISSGLANGDAFAEVYDRHACIEDSPIHVVTKNTEPEAIIAATQWILDNA